MYKVNFERISHIVLVFFIYVVLVSLFPNLNRFQTASGVSGAAVNAAWDALKQVLLTYSYTIDLKKLKSVFTMRSLQFLALPTFLARAPKSHSTKRLGLRTWQTNTGNLFISVHQNCNIIIRQK